MRRAALLTLGSTVAVVLAACDSKPTEPARVQPLSVSAAGAPANNHYQMAYTAFPTGNPDATDIYFLDTRSGVVTQLTSHVGRDQMPSWSPTGDKIVFSTTAFSAPGNAVSDLELAIMDVAADGTPGVPRQITWGNGAETYPAWSPTGNRIAYVCDLSPWPMPHYPHICYSELIGTDWHGPFPLTTDPPPFLPPPVSQTRLRDMHPTWSPDGNWVLYSRWCIVKGGACNFDDRELFMVQVPATPGAPGAPPIRVTLTPEVNEDNPSWRPTPTGNRDIAYNAVTYSMRGPVEFEAEDIYAMTMPSSLPVTTTGTQLTSRGDSDYPWWSSAGDEILFLSWRDGTWDLFRMLPDGSHQRNLTSTSTLDEGFGRLRPVVP